MSGNLFEQMFLTVKSFTAVPDLLYLPKANRYFCLLFIGIFVFNYFVLLFIFLSRTCRPECLNETQRLTLVTKSIVAVNYCSNLSRGHQLSLYLQANKTVIQD